MKWIKEISITASLLLSFSAWCQTCNVSNNAVNFGGYNPLTPSSIEALGYIDVACDVGIPFSIRLGPGQNSGGMFNPRKMHATGIEATLNYNLFRDSTRSEIWGDGTGGTFMWVGTGNGTIQQFIVYGLIHGSQNVPAGTYSDMLTVTIEW